MFEDLDQLKKRWADLAPPAELEQRVDRGLEATFIAASNLIEDKGALGLEETEVFLERELTSSGRRLEDFVALERHRDALREARAKARAGDPLTLDLIRGFHRSLTTGLKEKNHAPGEWRTDARTATSRRGRSVKTVAPEEVEGLVRDLLAQHEGQAATLHPVQAVAWFAYHFQLIQPFNEANGRVQRLVASFLLLKAGYRELVIEPRERQAYLQALAACDATVPADKLAPLFAGIATGTLAGFFAECLSRTLDGILSRIEGRAASDVGEVARASRAGQRALLIRLQREAPEIAWRHEAAGEVRRLTDRLEKALEHAKDGGPIYSIEVERSRIVKEHGADELVRSALPAGSAGIVGTVTLTLLPNPAAPVDVPAPRRFVASITSTRIGLHVVTRWSHEQRAQVRTGPPAESDWSQASLERHLAERVDSARREFDAEIVELNRAKDLKGALRGVTVRRPGLAARLAEEAKAAAAAAAAANAEVEAEVAAPPKVARRQAKEDRERERLKELELPRAGRRGEAAAEGKPERPRKGDRPTLGGIRPADPPLSI